MPATQPARATPRARADAEDPAILLGLLAAVERDAEQTQRGLARELGIALGLTNAYLKRCVRKGLVKVRTAPVRRYAYYLTPRGMTEKGRLTAQYLSDSLSFYRRARAACTALTDDLAATGRRRIALIGAGDLAEVVMLSAADSGLAVTAIIDPTGRNRRCAGRAVTATAPRGLVADALIIAAADPEGTLHAAAATLAARLRLSPDAIVMPDLARPNVARPHSARVATATVATEENA